jgi:hypothetical protein
MNQMHEVLAGQIVNLERIGNPPAAASAQSLPRKA